MVAFEEAELSALVEMGTIGLAHGASDMAHLDGPAAAFNYIRVARLIESYLRSGNAFPPILDWGCGYGQVSWLLERHGIPVISCDVESRPAREAIENLKNVKIEYLQDPIRLPYGDESFGVVLSVGVLEHAVDMEGSVREINRVLKPGGLFFVFMLPNRFSWAELIADIRGSSVHPCKFTFATTAKLLNTHGFAIEKRWRRNFLPRNLTGLSQRIKMTYGKFYRQIEELDALLSRFPPTSFFSGVVEVIAYKKSQVELRTAN